MAHTNWLWLKAMVLFCLILSACGVQSSSSDFLETQEVSGNPDPPEPFADLDNPFTGNQEAAREGEVLYQANCSSCHGITGDGDGTASAGLDPKPQNLTQHQLGLSDAYLFWRISEGGLMEPFNSLMPGWKGLLDEEQIWQLITYLRTL
jgi:cytochrome c oxidase cbb3-type subunit 3